MLSGSTHFLNPGLGLRLRKELVRFSGEPSEEQSAILQLVGSAYLCGWRLKAEWFKSVSLSQLGRLAVEVLPHDLDASMVNPWQFQLWLGLRAVASTIRKPIVVPPALIQGTLRLWRLNLANSEETGALIEHSVNLQMVKWLERCSKGSKGLLVPDVLNNPFRTEIQ
jgi:hypothetical protein